MKKPTMNVTESDVKDLFALMSSGYVGSWNLQETIGHIPRYVNDFTNASLDEIKDVFRQRMQEQVDALSEYAISDNLFLPDGKTLSDIGANSTRVITEGDLPLSKHGLGITGTWEVEMADGTVKNMDLMFAPVITMNDEATHQDLIEMSYCQEDEDPCERERAYLLNKYGDESLKNDRDAYAQSAWQNLPDTVLDLRDALYQDPYGLDWDDLQAHKPNLTYGKAMSTQTDVSAKLNENLVAEQTGLSADNQYGD